ncbi:MAG: translation initiation factor IF-2 [Pseudomonadota bacterium]|nr:translation initiation factor IF-2 [Pseudomonadota bacterium]
MTQKNEQDGKLTLRRPGRLELKKTVETGQVRQSFSHGRTKAVTVEVKKKRTFERGAGGNMRAVSEAANAVEAPKMEAAGVPELGNLTEEERAARIRALRGAAHDEERRQIAEIENQKRLEEEEKTRKEAEEAEQKAAEEEEARNKAEAELQAAAEAAAAAAPASEEAAGNRPKRAETTRSEPRRSAASEQPSGAPTRRPGKQEAEQRPTPRTRNEPRRRDRKLTITQALDEADGVEEDRVRSLAAVRRARERERLRAKEQRDSGEMKKVVREVVIPDTISVSDLANRMAIRGVDVVKALMRLDIMANVNHVLDAETAELIVQEFGHNAKLVSESDVEIGIEGEEDKSEDLTSRPPVVAVMGHVDHGKTSLLDALRATDVAAGEAGGITQHIGAYQIDLSDGQRITFIDTPGHAAFTAMRARGSQVTDIVVLVVAADDGVQPQTIEALNHAKAPEVPIIIAINKIDRPDSDADRVRNELLSHEIVVEKLGGDVLDVEVSATEKINLDKLEEAILLQAEIRELKSNPDRLAQGTVIEAKLERGRGAVATVLVQRGTLKRGDVFIAGNEWGRVRALIDDRGQTIQSAGPSEPIEVLGLQGAPSAGDELVAVEDEARAREITEYRQRAERQKALAVSGRGTLEQMFDQIQAGEAQELPIIIRCDVQGSIEAIVGALDNLSTDEVKVRVMHSAVGGITESDIILANSSGGLVLGFNVRANPQAREMANRDHVDIRYYSIIYNVIDDMKQLMEGLLAPEIRERQIGYAEVRDVFSVSRAGKAAGCMVTEGLFKRGNKVRLLRDDVVIFEGSLKSLRRFKDDVREVQQGYECGMAFENYDDIKEGDVIECFEAEEITRSL